MPKDTKERSAAWYLRNRERRLAQMRAAYRANPAKKIQATKQYHQAHPEVARKSWRKYQSQNRAACRERCRVWYRKNIDAQRARAKAKNKKYFAENRNKILAANRAWRQRNKEKVRERDLRRRARKLGAELGDQSIIREWMRQIKSKPFVRCHWCGTKVRGRKIHFDHIVALSKGGHHEIANLCASCADCNLSKQDKALSDWISRGQTFLSI